MFSRCQFTRLFSQHRQCSTSSLSPSSSTSKERNSERRVVVTGMGLVTPLGLDVEDVWKRLIAGECGISRMSRLPDHPFKSNVAAQVRLPEDEDEDGRGAKDVFQVKDYLSDHPSQNLPSPHPLKLPLSVQFAIGAASAALKNAGIERGSDRIGVSIGTGIGAMEEIYQNHSTLNERGLRRISPWSVPCMLPNLSASYVAMLYGLRGPNHSVSTACATGSHSIGDAYSFIKRGVADVMLAGGTEAAINPVSVAGFSRAHALSSKFNDHPEQSSRPFDNERDGFVIGEGSGVLCLEDLHHARNRDATIYAEITGYGLSADAFHMTSPPQDGNGARRAMEMALHEGDHIDDSGSVLPVDYINAHGTSTPTGDQAELIAISDLFGSRLASTSISSTKGATGHLLGAAGAVESIFTVLALRNGVVPPTLNLHSPQIPSSISDPSVLNLTPLHSTTNTKLQTALCNSFGFGGTNVSLMFAKKDDIEL